MTWLPDAAPGATPFERVIGLCPELRGDLTAFAATFERLQPLDPLLLALCAARVAQVLGRSAEAAATGLDAERLAALQEGAAGAGFTPRQRACLAFAEKFALDPHGISDADAAAVTAHLSPPEMVAFVEALAFCDGFLRFRAILGVDE